MNNNTTPALAGDLAINILPRTGKRISCKLVRPYRYYGTREIVGWVVRERHARRGGWSVEFANLEIER